MSTVQSHAVAHDVQDRLRSEIPSIQGVVVHVEPLGSPGKQSAALIPALRSLAEGLGIGTHSITARWVEGAYHVEAHVAVDGSLSLGTARALGEQAGRTSSACFRQSDLRTGNDL